MTSFVKADFYKTGFNRFSTNISDLYQGIQEWVMGKDSEKEQSQKIQAWLTAVASAKKEHLSGSLADDVDTFISWLGGLSSEETLQLYDQLDTFADAQGLDLSWLLEDELDNDIELKAGLEDALFLHGLALWRTGQLQDEINIFVAIRTWQADPLKKGQADLNQKLFRALINQELTASPPPELFLASEEERQTYIVKEIKQAIEKDKQTVGQLFKRVSTEDAGESGQTDENPTSPEPEEPVKESKPQQGNKKSGGDEDKTT
ncbi:hypothetical protein QUF58_14250 [Anaerolineales bacterium HSG24]|nr:hypothetical protein [Anaerolineales bacterium HSG24]